MSHSREGWALYLEAMRDWPKTPIYVVMHDRSERATRRKRLPKNPRNLKLSRLATIDSSDE